MKNIWKEALKELKEKNKWQLDLNLYGFTDILITGRKQ